MSCTSEYKINFRNCLNGMLSHVIAGDDKDKEELTVDEKGEPIKRKSRLVTPRSKNTETLISHVPTPGFDNVKIHHEPELQGGFKALRDKGIRITNYHEELPG